LTLKKRKRKRKDGEDQRDVVSDCGVGKVIERIVGLIMRSVLV